MKLIQISDCMTKVSVVVPAYNKGKYIKYTLNSVLNQTLREWECIIIDDGSTDNTGEIAKEYVHLDRRFKYYYQKNTGTSSAKNSGIIASSSKYICFLDSDDTLDHRMLEITVRYLDNHQDTSLVFGAWDIINEYGEVVSEKKGPFKSRDYLSDLVLRNVFPIHTLLLKKEIFNSCGLFDIDLKAHEDWDMWIRIACHGYKFGYINNVVAHYRVYSDNTTKDGKKMYESSNNILNRIINDYDRFNEIKIYIKIYQLLNSAIYYNREGEYVKSIECLENATNLYQACIYNNKYSILYCSLLRQLTNSEKFLNLILVKTPLLNRFELISNGFKNDMLECLNRQTYLKAICYASLSLILWPPLVYKYITSVSLVYNKITFKLKKSGLDIWDNLK